MAGSRKSVVVIGNGPVGHRFCERLVEFDTERRHRVVTFCEEPRPAYDRVRLTDYFGHRDASRLAVAKAGWYRSAGIDIRIGDRATRIDRDEKVVLSQAGSAVPYDRVVLATGSRPFVPPIPGVDKRGVFVYRTIEDLEGIIDYARTSSRCAVIGGGLLGLEAAKAAHDLGLETHVVEFASRLMPRQIDEIGSQLLVRRIEDLGVRVHLGKSTRRVLGNGRVNGMAFADGGGLDVDMIIVSAGIRPRDDLARECGAQRWPEGRRDRRRHPADLRSGHLRRRRGGPTPRCGLRPDRSRTGDGRGRCGGDVRPRAAVRRRPISPRSSSCWVSTSPASGTMKPPPTARSP